MAIGDLYQSIQNGTQGTLRQPMTSNFAPNVGNWFAQNAPSPSGTLNPNAGFAAPGATLQPPGSIAPAAPSSGDISGGSLRDQVIAKARAIGRMDIANNPDYWVGVIAQQGPNVDWGYWTDRMQSANQGGTGSNYGATNGQSGYGALPMGSLQTSNTFSPGGFSEPSEAQAMSSPGVQFALDEAQKAVERSAASKGTLLTGGTLKALAGYETGLAGQLYNDVFNRALSSASFNQKSGLDSAYYGLAANNQNYNQYANLANLGFRAAGGA